jgi:hypothetical protein
MSKEEQQQAVGSDDRIPISMLSGFLGAGMLSSRYNSSLDDDI